MPFIALPVRGGARALHVIFRHLTHFRAFVLLSRSPLLVYLPSAKPWLFHISNKHDKSEPRALGRIGSFHETVWLFALEYSPW